MSKASNVPRRKGRFENIRRDLKKTKTQKITHNLLLASSLIQSVSQSKEGGNR